MTQTPVVHAAKYTQTDLLINGWTKTSINRFLHPRVEGQTWTKEEIEAARSTAEARIYLERRTARVGTLEQLSLLDAVLEAANSALHWCNLGNQAWKAPERLVAAQCRGREFRLHGLKERGMVALHRNGGLRYMGSTARGLAVYEYGDSENQYLHSRLHPEGEKQLVVTGRPEIVLMQAVASHRIRQAKCILGSLPSHATGYIRSNVPAHIREREASFCWMCGELGHPATDCWTFSDYRSAPRSKRRRSAREMVATR